MRNLQDNIEKKRFLLGQDFFLHEDVVGIARALIGKYLVTEFDGVRTVGRIVETEAYRGPDDKACHAYNNRRTRRTEVMFGPGGYAYVYLCYGIHHLFNVVTGPENAPHAVLVRALEPLENLPVMLGRRGLLFEQPSLSNGPGALSQAMGIHTRHSGQFLCTNESPIRLEDDGEFFPDEDIIISARIGVQYAGTCAFRPWRFYLKNSPCVRKPKNKT